MKSDLTTTSVDSGEALRVDWRRANWMIGFGYVWFFAGIAAFTPFAALYYKHLGFSGVQVGILAAMPAIALILAGTALGAISDRYAAHRTILRGSLFLSAILAFVASRLTTFPALLLSIALLSFATVPLRSLMDHYAVVVGEHVGKHFGHIRLWGAFGYTAFALTLGRAMNSHLSSLFLVAYGVSLLLAGISTWALPETGVKRSEPLMEGIRSTLRSRQFLLLLLVAWMQASAASLIVVNLGVHIKSLGGSTAQVGAAFAIAAVSELPVFLFGAWVMRRIGAQRFLLGILAIYAIRMALLSVVDVPGGVILLQLLHGVTFAAFLVAGVPTARRLAGGRFPATAQAVLTMVSFGLGNITGSFLGGALMDRTSTSNVYRWTSLFMLLSVAIYAIGSRRHEREIAGELSGNIRS